MRVRKPFGDGSQALQRYRAQLFAGMILLGASVAFVLLLACLGALNWLPAHFLCCDHPEVTFPAFVLSPLTAGGFGVAAFRQAPGSQSPRRLLAATMASVGIVSALAGGFFLAGMKA